MIMPYLTFNGNCEEAFLWYTKIFNGKVDCMVKYGDMPENPDEPMSEELKRKVMHAQLFLTDIGGISGADVMETIEKGTSISIHAFMPTVSSAEEVFSALSEGGTVVGELATNPPPDDYGVSGCVKDKYGFSWIISAVK